MDAAELVERDVSARAPDRSATRGTDAGHREAGGLDRLWVAAGDDVAALVLAEGGGVVADLLQRRADAAREGHLGDGRSEEHTSELQSLIRTSVSVFRLKNKKRKPH